MQWLLRSQVAELVKPKAAGGRYEWPRELEVVVRDLWAMYMASVGVRDTPRDFLNGQEAATSYAGVREGMGRSRPHRKRRKLKHEEGNASENDEADEDADGQLEADEDRSRRSRSGTDTDTASQTDTESDSNPDADFEDNNDDTDAAVGHRAGATQPDKGAGQPYDLPDDLPQPRKRPWTFDDPRAKPRMDALLVILYLACITLRIPVFLRDIAHLAETYQIVYLNAKDHLPAAMWAHLDASAKRMLDPQEIKSLHATNEHTLMSLTRQLVKVYKEDWGIQFPEPNSPLLAWRLCRSLACPPPFVLITPYGTAPFYVYLKRLASLVPNFSLAIQPSVRTRPKNLEQIFVEPAEQVLVAGLVLIARMVWDLDIGGDGKPTIKNAGNLPDADTWLAAVEQVRDIQQSATVEALWAKETTNMSADDIDAYLDFFEQRIVPTSSVPSHMRDIDRFFPAPFDSKAPEPRNGQPDASTLLDEILSTLYARLLDSPLDQAGPYPDTTLTNETPHFHYVPSESCTLPRRLQLLYDHAARLVGTTSHEVQLTVTKLERKLGQSFTLRKRDHSTSSPLDVADARRTDTAHIIVPSDKRSRGSMKSAAIGVEAITKGLVRYESDDDDVSRQHDGRGVEHVADHRADRIRNETDPRPWTTRRSKLRREIEQDNDRLWREELARRAKLREFVFGAYDEQGRLKVKPVGTRRAGSTHRATSVPAKVRIKSKEYISSDEDEE
ncbi:hypothetical protein OIV83_005903 [Microbotryomycetes sp. JL201]|nr:hypothetical protein OIV83_005903 [Microbotryomycetes sp. JL201]